MNKNKITNVDNEYYDLDFHIAHPNQVLILACGALAREILALIEINNWHHLHLKCLPAQLHLYPDKITTEVEKAVMGYRNFYSHIFVAYADCGTGGRLESACKKLGVDMIKGPHCYSFFQGNKSFAATIDSEFTTFYLTDFLVRQFESFVWKPLGLDKYPQLQDMYFGNYTKLIYQAQTNDPLLDAKAQQCAKKLKLAFERRFTGYGDLANSLAAL